jgi:uncharacterized protein involved in exopolysaccharide biosynthesis
VPTVVVAVAAGIYAVTFQDTWEASQALIVRNEASNAEKQPGKFTDPEEMKTVQETILEMVKSRGVLEAALRQVGPPANCAKPNAWPTDLDVAAVRKGVKLVPPKGSEFGKTEVFYLNVRAESRERSIALNEAVLDQLQIQLKSLRDAKARSMIGELLKTVQIARTDLDTATAVLAGTEKQLGSDLAELRSMQDVTSSDSALRRSAEEIRGQLRDRAATEKTDRELLAILQAAESDPGKLIATSNQLLDSQPALRRLKEGLIDAQLRTSTLLGTMSDSHPRVQAARETEEEIGRRLHRELALAIRGVNVELRLNAERSGLLNEQLATTLARLNRVAAARATYANEVAEVKNRAAILERSEQNLAEARASEASAKASSLVSRIDSPDAGIRPLGPPRIVIALSGVLGGLLTGFGLVFLWVPAGTFGGALPTTAANGHAMSPDAGEYGSAVPSTPDRFTDRPTHRHPIHNGRLTLKQALQKLGDGRPARRAR